MQHEDYVQAAIIPPPITYNHENDIKYTRIVFDSKDRDVELFPEPNNYEVKFDDDIEDVLSVQLLSIDVPLSTYMINKYFSKLTFQTGASPVTVDLYHGDYTNTGLADMITSRMNSVASNNFLVEYDSIKDNYVFRSKVSFSVHFPEKNSLHMLLGFKNKTYTSIVDTSGPAGYGHIIKSEFRKNFKFNNYIIMTIEQFDLIKSNSNILYKTFAVIPDNYSNLNISNEPKIIKSFTPPVPRIAKIKISFMDRYGNLYDFQNIDHRIELLFASHKQARKYQNIFVNR